jgi:lactate permease
VSNFHGPWLVDVIAALVSMLCLTLFLKIWHPRELWHSTALKGHEADSGTPEDLVAGEPDAAGSAAIFKRHDTSTVWLAWMPWIILTILVFVWGIPQIKSWLDHVSILKFPIEGLNNVVEKVPPVVAKAVKEPAVYVLNWLSATGTGILVASIIAGFAMKYSPLGLLHIYGHTIWKVRYSLITISAMLALGTLTRYAGADATMGLAFATAGVLYPFFGTLLGWLGVAVTGSDTASNVLFGGLQRVTAEQIGLNPILMGAANSSGGVMGKMIDAQSIVVASTATNWFGHEGDILRYVFFHSIALAALVGLLVTMQAYVPPFTSLVH